MDSNVYGKLADLSKNFEELDTRLVVLENDLEINKGHVQELAGHVRVLITILDRIVPIIDFNQQKINETLTVKEGSITENIDKLEEHVKRTSSLPMPFPGASNTEPHL